MNIKNNILIALTTGLLVTGLFFSGVALAVSGIDFELQDDIIASGIGASSSGGYTLVSITGQVISGTSESSGYRLGSGCQIGIPLGETSQPGDADSDGDVDVHDIVKVVRVILDIDEETSGSDVDGNGKVNVLDITGIIRIILGLE